MLSGLRRKTGNPSERRYLRRLLGHPRRWFAGLAVALVLGAVIALSVLDLPQSISGVGDTSDNLVRNLVTALVLAILAYLWFYFWTSAWATRDLLRVAQRSPERLFPHAPEIGSAEQVFGRDRLVAEIVAGLRPPFGVGPQIVVGETGTGKTTLLLAIAAALARGHSVLPVVLNLRDEDRNLEQHDFSKLAVDRFRELIDPYIRTEAEADKLWRWMCRRRRIVVLADDLDKSRAAVADPYKVRLALDSARRRNLPLVLTTRAAGLPPDLRDSPIDLARWPLEADTPAREYVLRRAGRAEGDREAGAVVEATIESGRLAENAFYLVVLARLLRAGALTAPPTGGKHAVRRALLDADRERLCGAGVDLAEAERREETLGRVELLACALLSPCAEPALEKSSFKAVHDGERFGLLSLDEQANPQFRHDVLHAYYASRAIVAGDRAWVAALDDAPNAPRVQLALVLAAARRESHDFCREACEKLLAEVGEATADQRILRASAAAEIARAGGFHDCDDRIVESCVRAREDAGPVAKQTALDQIELLEGAAAVESLWSYSGDADYDTRWIAVEKLVRRCSGVEEVDGEAVRTPLGTEAYEVLDPKIEAALEVGRELLRLPEERRPDDWEPEIVTLKQIAWMLPALRTGAKDPVLRERIGGHLDELLRLEEERVTLQRGLEASVAQGFKADAKLHPDERPDPRAAEMLRDRAVFWYSQLNLVHALALRMASDEGSRSRTLARLVKAVARREREARRRRLDGSAIRGRLHPMFRFAARLCVRGLSGRAGEGRVRRISRRVWDDEGVVVSGRPTELDPAAAQLVGEIVVLLNLNETGSIAQRREFGEETTVPHCLGRSRDRHELRSGCRQSCRFRLCPFQPVQDRVSAHREISQAFCRDQRHYSRWLRAWRWRSWVGRRALPDFWRWMEGRARF